MGTRTPCFSTRQRFENIGSALGQWEAAGGFQNFYGIAPKVYTFEHDPENCHRSHGEEKECDGRKTQKAKGVRLGKRDLIVGETYEAGGILGFRAGAALGQLFKRNTLSRKIRKAARGSRPGSQGRNDASAARGGLETVKRRLYKRRRRTRRTAEFLAQSRRRLGNAPCAKSPWRGNGGFGDSGRFCWKRGMSARLFPALVAGRARGRAKCPGPGKTSGSTN
jgi:hypothetical protein